MKHSISVIIIMLMAAGCQQRPKLKTVEGYTATPSGLQFKITEQGTGAAANEGDDVMIEEETLYLDGTLLFSNVGGPAVKVKIGAGQATEAVDQSLRGMKVGETKEVIAPPHLVKRRVYPPNVSPDSALMMRITVKKIL